MKHTKNKMTTVLGTYKKIPRTRIWIEGSRLAAHGFIVGARFNREVEVGRIQLKLDAEGTHKVCGKGDKPIIDITGRVVTNAFPEQHMVKVRYSAGLITIVVL